MIVWISERFMILLLPIILAAFRSHCFVKGDMPCNPFEYRKRVKDDLIWNKRKKHFSKCNFVESIPRTRKSCEFELVDECISIMCNDRLWICHITVAQNYWPWHGHINIVDLIVLCWNSLNRSECLDLEMEGASNKPQPQWLIKGDLREPHPKNKDKLSLGGSLRPTHWLGCTLVGCFHVSICVDFKVDFWGWHER